LYVSVQPDPHTFVLKYRVPNNKMHFKARVGGPNPSIHMDFILETTMRVETKGPARDPLVVKSAHVSLRSPSVDIDSDPISTGVRGLIEFVRGKTFASDVETAINGKGAEVTAALGNNIGPINEKLRPYTVDRGYRKVEPRFDNPTRALQLVMSQPVPTSGTVPKSAKVPKVQKVP
jgi:hypothetical protein